MKLASLDSSNPNVVFYFGDEVARMKYRRYATIISSKSFMTFIRYIALYVITVT